MGYKITPIAPFFCFNFYRVSVSTLYFFGLSGSKVKNEISNRITINIYF